MGTPGLVRDFSDDAKKELFDIIDNIDQQDNNGFKEFLDFFADWEYHFQDLFGQLKIDNYLDNIASFHQKILDKDDIGKQAITELFEKVYEVDREYAAKVRSLQPQLDAIENTLASLGDIFQPSDIGGYALESPIEEFQWRLEAAGMGLATYYTDLFMQIDEDGTITYNWDEIRKIMEKDPEKVGEAEYYALTAVLSSMTYMDDNGNYIVNTEAMERFIECSYTMNVYKDIGKDGQTYTTYIYTLSPVFANVSAIYNQAVHELVQESQGYLFGDNKSLEWQYLQAEMFKSTVLGEICMNAGKVYVYNQSEYSGGKVIQRPDGQFSSNQVKPIKFSIEYVVPDGNNTSNYYRIETNGYMQYTIGSEIKFTNHIDVYEFRADSQGVFNDEAFRFGESLYKNNVNSITKALGGKPYNQMVSSVKSMLKAPLSATGSYMFNAIDFGWDQYKKSIEIETNNAKVDEFIKNINLENYFTALQIGASITRFGDKVTVHNAYVNQRDLYIALACYNKETNSNLSVDEILREFDTITSTGESGENVKQYVKWYMNDKANVRDYSDRLEKILKEYCIVNSIDIDIENLTYKQLNSLIDKERNPDYILNLE